MTQFVVSSSGVAEVAAQLDQLSAKQREQREAARQAATEQRSLWQQGIQVAKSFRDEQDKLNAKVSALKEAWKAGLIGQKDYDSALNNLQKKMDTLKETKPKLFGSDALNALKTYAASVVSLAAVFRGITNEMQLQKELANEEAQRRATISQARSALIRNLVGKSPEDIQRTLDTAAERARVLGVGQREYLFGLAEAVSAGGGNVPAATAAVDVASQFLFDEQAAIGTFSGTLLDIAKVTGSQDALTNLGFLSFTGGLSRVASQRALAESAPRALIGATGLGFSKEQAMAAFAALTVGAGDFSGKTSATGLTKLAQQLQEFGERGGLEQTSVDEIARNHDRLLKLRGELADLTESERRDEIRRAERLRDAKKRVAEANNPDAKAHAQENLEALVREQGWARGDAANKIRDTRNAITQTQQMIATGQGDVERERELFGRYAALRTGDERLRFMQQNPVLLKRFMDTASFEANMIAPMMSLLSGRGATAEQFFANMGQVGGVDFRAVGQQQIANLNLNELQREQRVRQRLEAEVETRAVDRSRLGLVSQEELKLVRQILMQEGRLGTPFQVEQFLGSLNLSGHVGVSTREQLMETLRREANMDRRFSGLDREQTVLDPINPRTIRSLIRDEAFELTPEQRQRAERIKTLLEAIERIMGDVEKNTRPSNNGDGFKGVAG